MTRKVRQPGLGDLPLERIDLSKINPAPYNPRVELKPGDPEYENLATSIDEFGLVEPLIWNKQTGNLVGGHQRLTVLRARGVKSTDVVVVDLDESREKTLNIALNKISGHWDNAKLAEVMDDLVSDDTIDELLTGFDAAEIERLLEEQLDVDDDEADDEPHTQTRHSFKVGNGIL